MQEKLKNAGVRAVLMQNTLLLYRMVYSDATRKLLTPLPARKARSGSVAAETPYQAWDAARAIKVKYETLPFLSDEQKALEPGAPAVHQSGNRSGDVRVTRARISKGVLQRQMWCWKGLPDRE